MTILERIADWISGGSVSQAREDLKWVDKKRMQWADMAMKRDDALRRIAACETPGANATVRRMARIAREALE